VAVKRQQECGRDLGCGMETPQFFATFLLRKVCTSIILDLRYASVVYRQGKLLTDTIGCISEVGEDSFP